MRFYSPLPAGAEAAYIQLYEIAQQAEFCRSISNLSGSIQFKDVGGKSYAYFAYRDAITGRGVQLYIGPDSPAVRELRTRCKQDPPSALAIGRHAGAALSHGCSSTISKHYRVIRQLADSQFFRAGGLLIGSHAFQALGNMLGVRWGADTTTLDVDFAHAGRSGNISVALPADLHINVHSAIEALEMGFLPATDLGGRSNPSTYANPAEPELRLDFLTTPQRTSDVVEEPALGVALQPMKFMDYLIEQPTQSVLIRPTAAVVINVPSPGRFALHKLIVAQERPVKEQTKANKDVRQAAALLEYLMDQAPHELDQAWSVLQEKGAGWVQRIDESQKPLASLAPELAARFAQFRADN